MIAKYTEIFSRPRQSSEERQPKKRRLLFAHGDRPDRHSGMPGSQPLSKPILCYK